ncbi:sensor histidine kinase [Advenella sp. RU8]|uniref:sensor histidine kinase n=1 Tax=Advenella sp. RU8 TaxID=3399575 RepID=UPI003AAA20D8
MKFSCRHFYQMLLLFCMVAYSGVLSAKTWYVGILAPRGVEVAQQEWQPWLNWLSAQWENETFILVPMKLADAEQMIADNRVNFVLAPQAQFLSMKTGAEMRWLATLNRVDDTQPKAAELVGSALWVRKDSGLRDITQLHDKTIAAVQENAFGGFLLAYKLLHDAQLRENRDYALVFTDYPIDQTLLLLDRKQVDAAIAPLCLMEEMHAQGILDRSHFQLLHPVNNQSACAGSTELFPNWSLAALPDVPDALATRVGSLLLQNRAGASLPGWSPVVASTRVEEILHSIRRHPFQQSVWIGIQDWVAEYKTWVGLALLLVLLSFLNYGWVSWLAWRRQKQITQAYERMRTYERMMMHADRLNILGEMASGVAHEVNQPVSVIRHYAEGTRYRLQKQQTNSEMIPVLDKIIEQVERITQIIENLRKWVKSDRNYQSMPVNIAQAVGKSIQFVRLQNERHPMDIHIDIPADLVLVTVPSVIEQVLVNSLLNCWQQQATQVDISIRHFDDGFLGIAIMDNAGGFSQEQLDFPFVPFRTNKEQGLGLGLVICERLMRVIGGNLLLDNRGDGVAGAMVTLKLPIKENATNQKELKRNDER